MCGAVRCRGGADPRVISGRAVNIEQKNTLFVIGLVLMVLVSVAALAYGLVKEHVRDSIRADLQRAQHVFMAAQQSRFDTLTTMARGMRSDSRLIAATLSGDAAAVRGKLLDLRSHADTHLLAVYRDTRAGGVAVVGGRLLPVAPTLLHSQALGSLASGLARGQDRAYGHALLYDALLQLVAVPIQSQADGRPAVLVVGRRFAQADLAQLRSLVSADIAVVSDTAVLLSDIPQLAGHLPRLLSAARRADSVDLTIGAETYTGRVLPIPDQLDAKARVAHLLLAVPHSVYWGPYRILGENALYFSTLILLLAALLGISISRNSLTRPIQLLARATQAIASGDLNQQVKVKRRDELGLLTQSFNTMLSALNRSRAELENSRQRFHDFADSSSDWLWESDRAGRFTYVSASASQTLDIPAEALLGRTLQEVFGGSALGELMALLRPAAQPPRMFKDVEAWIITAEAGQRCLRLNGVPVIAGGRFEGYRGTARDITKLKQDEKRMVILANQDHLTGLANRRRFLLDLNHEIARVEHNARLGMLALIDLDHLKLVNDTAGHAAGDQIIVQVAGLLRRSLAEPDLLARVSGDEFAVAYCVADERQGMEKARALFERISALKPRYGGRTLNISASIGVVIFPRHGTEPVELLAKADAAMGGAKQAGRNRLHLYDESDAARERMDTQLVWKDRLLEALDDSRLSLAYQPIVSAASGRVSHYEVLVRMWSEDGKLVVPGKFIPAAEQFGLIQRLDRFILSKAIQVLAGLPPEQHIGFAVNLSGLSVGDPEVLELIQREIRRAGIAPERLTFEITETAACEQLNTAMEFIRQVRQLGCKVALDDFGVGFSSFAYLKHLRADTLKIDGSFIRDIHNNNADQLFVKALIDVARGMGMRTTAEFVENEQVYQRVVKLGVDFVQGYYLGKPQVGLDAQDTPQQRRRRSRVTRVGVAS